MKYKKRSEYQRKVRADKERDYFEDMNNEFDTGITNFGNCTKVWSLQGVHDYQQLPENQIIKCRGFVNHIPGGTRPKEARLIDQESERRHLSHLDDDGEYKDLRGVGSINTNNSWRPLQYNARKDAAGKEDWEKRVTEYIKNRRGD